MVSRRPCFSMILVFGSRYLSGRAGRSRAAEPGSSCIPPRSDISFRVEVMRPIRSVHPLVAFGMSTGKEPQLLKGPAPIDSSRSPGYTSNSLGGLG